VKIDIACIIFSQEWIFELKINAIGIRVSSLLLEPFLLKVFAVTTDFDLFDLPVFSCNMHIDL